MKKLALMLCIMMIMGCTPKIYYKETPPVREGASSAPEIILEPVQETPESAAEMPEQETLDSKDPEVSEIPKSESELVPLEQPLSKPAPADPAQPMVALTFDDGPCANTRRLLDILTANNSKATFFVPGYQLIKFKDTARAIVDQGSEIAGHSWSHTLFTKLTGGEIWLEIDDTNNAIFEATGVAPKIYRLPFGSANDVVKNISREMGMSIINWSVDTEDWKYRDADKIYEIIMRDVKSGSIILCHDSYSTTIDAMEIVIPALIEQGYSLVTVSELLGEIEPGIIYTRR